MAITVAINSGAVSRTLQNVSTEPRNPRNVGIARAILITISATPAAASIAPKVPGWLVRTTIAAASPRPRLTLMNIAEGPRSCSCSGIVRCTLMCQPAARSRRHRRFVPVAAGGWLALQRSCDIGFDGAFGKDIRRAGHRGVRHNVRTAVPTASEQHPTGRAEPANARLRQVNAGLRLAARPPTLLAWVRAHQS